MIERTRLAPSPTGALHLGNARTFLATWAMAWLVHRSLVAYPDLSGGTDGRTVPSPARLVSTSLGVEVTLRRRWAPSRGRGP